MAKEDEGLHWDEGSHWEDCEVAHHDCAMRLIAQLRAALGLWRSRAEKAEDHELALSEEGERLTRERDEALETLKNVEDNMDKQAKREGQDFDETWRRTVLLSRPEYGDWEYPGFFHRHLRAEFEEVYARTVRAEERVKKLEEALRGYMSAWSQYELRHVSVPPAGMRARFERIMDEADEKARALLSPPPEEEE